MVTRATAPHSDDCFKKKRIFHQMSKHKRARCLHMTDKPVNQDDVQYSQIYSQSCVSVVYLTLTLRYPLYSKSIFVAVIQFHPFSNVPFSQCVCPSLFSLPHLTSCTRRMIRKTKSFCDCVCVECVCISYYLAVVSADKVSAPRASIF